MGIVTAAVNPNEPTTTQITNDDPGGMVVFPRSTSLGGFFGATPVAQPAGNGQSMAAGAQAGGLITTWSTTQSPAAVAPNTSAEVGITIQSGTVTNAAQLIASGDLLYINKPTAQAGLGIGNVRVSASNSAGVTFSNATAATVTPTASEVYKFVSLRGMANVSATLTPAAVQPNTTTEQQFTIVPTTASPQGIPVGTLVQVSKPTAQAGLDIVGVRAVSNNVVGVTFANFTAATITPTAAESYTFLCTPGLDSLGNQIGFQFNAGTIGAIGAGLVITGGSTTVTGVLATDVPIGPASQPTAQPVATNAAFPALTIAAANSLTMYFAGIGSGATPTASLPYNQLVYRQNPAAPLLLYKALLTPVSVAANTTAEQTFTVTGLISGTPVWVNKPSWQTGLGIVGVRVSATNTLAITYANLTAAAIVPTTETYTMGNFQIPAPGAGNAVYQSTGNLDVVNTNIQSSLISSMTALGLIKGS